MNNQVYSYYIRKNFEMNAKQTPSGQGNAAEAVAKCYTQALVAEGAGQASSAQINLLTDYTKNQSPITLESILNNPVAAKTVAQKVENNCKESANETTEKVGDIFSKFFKSVLNATGEPKNPGQYNDTFKLLLLKAYWLSHYSGQSTAKQSKDKEENLRRVTYITNRKQTVEKLEKDVTALADSIKNGIPPKKIVKNNSGKKNKYLTESECQTVIDALHHKVPGLLAKRLPRNCSDLNGISMQTVRAFVKEAQKHPISDAVAWMKDFEEAYNPSTDCWQAVVAHAIVDDLKYMVPRLFLTKDPPSNLLGLICKGRSKQSAEQSAKQFIDTYLMKPKNDDFERSDLYKVVATSLEDSIGSKDRMIIKDSHAVKNCLSDKWTYRDIERVLIKVLKSYDDSQIPKYLKTFAKKQVQLYGKDYL